MASLEQRVGIPGKSEGLERKAASPSAAPQHTNLPSPSSQIAPQDPSWAGAESLALHSHACF